MADPLDSTPHLADLAFQTYMKTVYDERDFTRSYRTLGKTIKFIEGKKIPIRGKTFDYIIQKSPVTMGRRTQNKTANYSPSRANSAVALSVNLGSGVSASEAAAASDVIRLDFPFQVDRYTIKMQAAQGVGCFRNWMAEIAMGRKREMAEMVDQAVHQPKSARLATVLIGASQPKSNEDGTAYTAGQNEVRFAIENGALLYFYRDLIIDIRNGATNLFYARVDEINPRDSVMNGKPSITVTRLTTDGGGASSTDANCNNVANGNSIYRSGEYTATGGGNNVVGLDTWFNATTPGTIFGADRTALGNGILIPSETGSATSPAVLTLPDFDDAFELMQYNIDLQNLPKGPLVALSTPELISKICKEFRNGAAVEYSVAATPSLQKMYGQFGFSGVVFQHASLGKPIMVQADMACMPNRIYILSPKSWFIGDLGPPENIGATLGGGSQMARIIDKDASTPFYRDDREYMFFLACDYPQANHVMRYKAV